MDNLLFDIFLCAVFHDRIPFVLLVAAGVFEPLSDRLIARVKDNPIVATLIVVGIIVVALSTFTDAIKNLWSLVKRKPHETSGSSDVPEIWVTGSSSLPEVEVQERTLYDSSQMLSPYDFEGVGGELWDGEKYLPPRAEGTLEFLANGVLNVERSNTGGRFEIHLRKYLWEGQSRAYVPKNVAAQGDRRVRVNCEVKVLDGTHRLRFAIKERENSLTNYTLGEYQRSISDSEWISLSFVFHRIPPTQDFYLRIDDMAEAAPSSVQIRNLTVAEGSG